MVLKGVGRAVRAAGRKAESVSGGRLKSGLGMATVGGVMVGAAGIGAGSAVLDTSGPWGDVNETLTGTRNIWQYGTKAAIMDSVRDSSRDNYNPLNTYYGRPFDSREYMNRRNSGAPMVDGSINFGMWNTRTGGIL